MNTRKKPSMAFPVLAVIVLAWSVFLSGNLAAQPYAYVTNCFSNNVSVIDTETDTVANTIPVGPCPVGVAISPDGSRIYVVNNAYYSGYTGSVSVIDAETNTVIANFVAGQNPKSAAVHPTLPLLYVVTNYGRGNVLVFNTTSLSLVATIPVGGNPNCMVIHPDGSRLYVANSTTIASPHGQDVSVIDTTTNTETAIISTAGAPLGLAIDPVGTSLYVMKPWGSNKVAVIDTSSNTMTASIAVGVNPYGGVTSSDGTLLYVTNFDGGTVSVVDTSLNLVTNTVTVGSGAYGVDINPEGTRLYAALYYENKVAVVDTETESLLYKVQVGSNPGAWGRFIGPGATTENQPPTAQCVDPAPQTADAACQAGIAAEIIDGGSSDPDGDTLALTLDPPGPFPLGTTEVTLTVTDPDGLSDSCTANVTVQDTTPPTISTLPDVSVSNDPGACNATSVDLGTPDAADNCPGFSVSHAPLEPYPWTTTWVQWTVEDGSGNTASTIQTVTVNDTESPTIQCPADLELTTTSSEGTSVSYTVGSSDNCGEATIDCDLPSDSLFGLGTTTVTCTATDAAIPTANEATCQFDVSVALSTADTPEELIQNLINQVKRLMAEGILNAGQGNSLISKLNNILAKLLRGQVGAACNQMGAFVNQVTAFVKARILPAGEGTLLIDAATNIQSILGC